MTFYTLATQCVDQAETEEQNASSIFVNKFFRNKTSDYYDHAVPKTDRYDIAARFHRVGGGLSVGTQRGLRMR